MCLNACQKELSGFPGALWVLFVDCSTAPSPGGTNTCTYVSVRKRDVRMTLCQQALPAEAGPRRDKPLCAKSAVGTESLKAQAGTIGRAVSPLPHKHSTPRCKATTARGVSDYARYSLSTQLT